MNTQFHETQGRYRARRGGRRSRRRGTGIMRSLLSLDPVQTWTNAYSSNQASGVNQASTYGVGLYTTQMTGDTDLQSICTDAGYNIGTTTDLTAKLMIKSAVMDVQFMNTGSSPIIVDVYDVVQRKDPHTTGNVGTQFNTYFNYQTAITAESANDIAVSLFENPVFCQFYKILHKTEVLLGNGEVITRQMKLTRPRLIKTEIVSAYPSAYPRINRFWVFSWHGLPNATANSGSAGILATTVTISVQKVYHWQYIPSSQTRARQHNAGD